MFRYQSHDNKTQHSPSLSGQTHVLLVGMSKAHDDDDDDDGDDTSSCELRIICLYTIFRMIPYDACLEVRSSSR